MKYVKRTLFNSKISSKKEFIKEVKRFHHKMLFHIPIDIKEVENIAMNPYFDIGYNCAWESTEHRIERICANKIVKNLLTCEGTKR